PSTGIFTHYSRKEGDPHSLTSDSITTIMEDHEGTVWVGTENGLNRYDSKTNQFIRFEHKENDPASLSSNQVRVIYEDKSGTIWVGCGNPFIPENKAKEGGLNKLNRESGS